MSKSNDVVRAGKRGRKPIDIGVYELQDVINVIEELHPNGKFDNRSQLWEAVAQSKYWETRGKPITVSPQTLLVMAKKHNLTMATPVGKRGRQKGCAPIANAGRKAKRISEEAEAALRKRFPLDMVTGYGDGKDKPLKSLPKTIDGVIKGRLKMVIKAMCLDCTNLQPKEVRYCKKMDCPQWSVRPYRKK